MAEEPFLKKKGWKRLSNETDQEARPGYRKETPRRGSHKSRVGHDQTWPSGIINLQETGNLKRPTNMKKVCRWVKREAEPGLEQG